MHTARFQCKQIVVAELYSDKLRRANLALARGALSCRGMVWRIQKGWWQGISHLPARFPTARRFPLARTAANPLDGQAAVVTGSSSGIGRAIALELARAGADVLVHARANRDGAEATAVAVRRLGRDARVVMGDLSDPAEQDRLCADAWRWREIDVWINNAGANILTGPARDWTFEQKLTALWSVDVVATLRITRDIGRRMKSRGHGLVLNMGWDRAAVGMEGDSGELFAATKGANMAATRSLAKSLAPTVRVNCLAPGWIRTEWGENASSEWQDRAKRESLLDRWGTSEDIAGMACFLATPAASFINGQVININGGLS